MKAVGSTCALALAVALVWAVGAEATAGNPDPSFSGDGIAVVQLGELDPDAGIASWVDISPLGVDSSGKIVLGGGTVYQTSCYGHLGCSYAGYATVIRLNGDGSLDPTLAGDGTLETDLGLSYPSGSVTSIEPDGSLLFGGSVTNPYVALVTREGDLDLSFGDHGFVRFMVPNQYGVSSVQTAVQSDGRIVVAVVSTEELVDVNHDLTLIRLMPDGSLDPSFGTGGLTQTHLRPWYVGRGALSIDQSDRIVVNLATAAPSPGDENAQLDFYRYDSDGLADQTFGSSGHAFYPVGALSSAVARVAIDSSGRIYSLVPNDVNAILRLTAAGTPDAAYGPNGLLRLSDVPGSAGGRIGSVSMGANDRLLVGGVAGSRLVVGRRLSDGSADPTFGLNGWADVNTLVSSPKPAAALELPSGRVIAAAGSGDRACAAVLELTGDSDPAQPAGPVDGAPCVASCKPIHGCPRIQRSLTISLRHRHPGRVITGELTANYPGCHPAVELVWFQAPGGDPIVQVDSPKPIDALTSRYRFRIGHHFRAAKVYARVRTESDPAAGTCEAARSARLTLPRTHQRR